MKEDNFKRFAEYSSLEEAINCEIPGVWYQKHLPNNNVDDKELERERLRRTLFAKEVNGSEAEYFRFASKWKVDDSEIDTVITKYFQAKDYQLRSQPEKMRKVFQKEDILLSIHVANLSDIEQKNESIIGSILQYKIRNGKIRNAVPNKITGSFILEYKFIQGCIVPFRYSKPKLNHGRLENGKIQGYM